MFTLNVFREAEHAALVHSSKDRADRQSRGQKKVPYFVMRRGLNQLSHVIFLRRAVNDDLAQIQYVLYVCVTVKVLGCTFFFF